MTYITEYAKKSSIPGKALRYLNRKKLLNDPLADSDFDRLLFLESIWGDKRLLRAQLSKLSYKAQQSFIRTAHLDTKWERYAFSRFFNMEPGHNLPMKELIEEIQTTFNFILSKQQIAQLHHIRNRARVRRHREKMKSEQEWEKRLHRTNK